jgi:hypothetical protein
VAARLAARKQRAEAALVEAPGAFIWEKPVQVARAKHAAFKAQTALAAYPWLYGIVRDCYHRQWEGHTPECRNVNQEMPWPDGSSMQLGLGLIAPGTSPSEAAAH